MLYSRLSSLARYSNPRPVAHTQWRRASSHKNMAEEMFFWDFENMKPKSQVHQVYVLGSGEKGQLGRGPTDTMTLNPERIAMGDVAKVVVGHNHAFALANKKELLSWGYNEYGQCGVDHRDTVDVPTRVDPFEGHQIDHVAVGPLQTFIATTNLKTNKQAIWHCGMAYPDDNTHDLFTAHTAKFRKTKKKKYLGREKIRKIIPAGDFCVMISEHNRIYTFGVNGSHGALGHSLPENQDLPSVPGPVLVPSIDTVEFQDAAVGWGHTLALTTGGEILTWGNNEHGQLGLGKDTEHEHEPQPINYFSIACGETHSVALDMEGRVHTWGSHAEGKLGLGDERDTDANEPQLVTALEGKNIVHIAAGTDHTVAVGDDGEIYCWGFGQHGQLGPSRKNQASPIPIQQPSFFSPKFLEDDSISKEMKTQIPLNTPLRYGDRKVHSLEYFERWYDHRFVDVGCGMDGTFYTLESVLRENPKTDEELIEKEDPEAFSAFKEMKKGVQEKLDSLSSEKRQKIAEFQNSPEGKELLRRLENDPDMREQMRRLETDASEEAIKRMSERVQSEVESIREGGERTYSPLPLGAQEQSVRKKL